MKSFKAFLTEAPYEVYHQSFTSAIQHALEVAKKKGYEVDEDDYFTKVSTGPRKPSPGKTNSYVLELTKGGKPVNKRLSVQIYGMERGSFELNMYIS